MAGESKPGESGVSQERATNFINDIARELAGKPSIAAFFEPLQGGKRKLSVVFGSSGEALASGVRTMSKQAPITPVSRGPLPEGFMAWDLRAKQGYFDTHFREPAEKSHGVHDFQVYQLEVDNV